MSKNQRQDCNDKAINFAKQYAGCDVHLLNRESRVIDTIARVIGYYTDLDVMILLDFPNDATRQRDCWDIKDNPAVNLTVNETITKGWCIDPYLVRAIKIHNPYPHRCGLCKAPARKNKSILICSNTSCKSSRQYMSLLKREVIKTLGTSTACPICSTDKMFCIVKTEKLSDTYKAYHLKCVNNHDFILQPKINDTLSLEQSIYRYNGKLFTKIKVSRDK